VDKKSEIERNKRLNVIIMSTGTADTIPFISILFFYPVHFSMFLYIEWGAGICAVCVCVWSGVNRCNVSGIGVGPFNAGVKPNCHAATLSISCRRWAFGLLLTAAHKYI
jgi:hypothetical protein